MLMAYQRQNKESRKDASAFSESETVALKENIALEGPVFPLVPSIPSGLSREVPVTQ